MFSALRGLGRTVAASVVPTSPAAQGLVEQAEVLGSASSVLFVRWATKKQGGSSNNGRDSNPKFLGIKKFGGEYVKAGNIIARQRGTKWHPGDNCGIGVDHTLFALVEGRVHFSDNHIKKRKVVNIVPLEDWPKALAERQAKNAAKRANLATTNGQQA